MKLHADRDRCIGAGLCVLSAPTLFDQEDSDGLVVLLTEHPAEADAADARKIADHICPSKAIRISEV